ncbi:MAG: hypothetical protein KDK08_23960 [Rhizobiaceae bacterium]|nr:hypothetical protein [Rhizobiaceae bacterium]
MRAAVPLQHEFVDSAPERMEQGIVYVSIKYRSVIHLCVCGCGNEVVTPLSPTDWRLTFDGVSVSLDPSVGNWSLPCRSHYFVRRNNAIWADDWSNERVAAGREYDQKAKEAYFNEMAAETKSQPAPGAAKTQRKVGLIQRVIGFILGDTWRK